MPRRERAAKQQRVVAPGPKQSRSLAPSPKSPSSDAAPPPRPSGPRTNLGAAFLEAMQADFAAHGVAAIRQLREDKPDQYLRVIVSILPKELSASKTSVEDMTDDELVGVLSAVRALVAAKAADEDRTRAGKPASPRAARH
jgi:hypothetical protein